MNKQDQGYSLLELMAVVLIIAIIAISTLPLLHEQMAAREIDAIARRFIAHAQFARSQAFQLGTPVSITLLNGGLWEEGWVVKNVCDSSQPKSICIERHWISQGDLAQVHSRVGVGSLLTLIRPRGALCSTPPVQLKQPMAGL